MRKYHNTNQAKAFIYYIMTSRCIDYRYGHMEINKKLLNEIHDFDTLLNYIEGVIRNTQYKFKKLKKKYKNKTEYDDQYYEEYDSIQSEFSSKIPILSTIHLGNQEFIFEKFIEEYHE